MKLGYIIPIKVIDDKYEEIRKNYTKYVKSITPTLKSIGGNILQIITNKMYSLADVEELSKIDIDAILHLNETYPDSNKNRGYITINGSGTLRYKNKGKYPHNDIQRHISELRMYIKEYLDNLFDFATGYNIVIYSNPVYGSLEDNYWRQDISVNVSILF